MQDDLQETGEAHTATNQEGKELHKWKEMYLGDPVAQGLCS